MMIRVLRWIISSIAVACCIGLYFAAMRLLPAGASPVRVLLLLAWSVGMDVAIVLALIVKLLPHAASKRAPFKVWKTERALFRCECCPPDKQKPADVYCPEQDVLLCRDGETAHVCTTAVHYMPDAAVAARASRVRPADR